MESVSAQAGQRRKQARCLRAAEGRLVMHVGNPTEAPIELLGGQNHHRFLSVARDPLRPLRTGATE